MSKNYLNYKKLFFLIILFFLLITPLILQAQNPYLDRLEGVGTQAYDQTPGDPRAVIMSIVTILLGFLGVVFIILIIAGGYQWLTSGGNEEKIKHARDRIIHAIIGLIIIILSYAIAFFVTNQLENITFWW